MKRFFCGLLVLLCLWTGAAWAEGEASSVLFEEYALAIQSFSDEEWEAEGSLRTLMTESGTSLAVCLSGDEIAALTVEVEAESADMDEVRAAIVAFVNLDEDALTDLLNAPRERKLVSDGCVLWRMEGELRIGFALCAEADAGGMRWQPVHGGEKLHVNHGCSGMDVARLVTPEVIEELGIERCQRCKKPS